MANTYTLIASSTIGAGGASSITFNSIPSTYTDLKVVASTRNTATNTLGLLPIRFNGSSSSLSSIVLYGFGSNQGSGSYNSVSYAIWGYTNGATSTSSVFASTEFYIPNYTSSNYKSVSVDSVNENNATDGRQSLTAGLWSNTAAITSITLDALDGGAGAVNFVQYSTAYLYGIKNS